MTMICCNKESRTIGIDTPSGRLTMGFCNVCEQRHWFHGTTEIAIREVLDITARTWNKRRHLQAV